MTQNQLAYWANKERERSNRAQERLSQLDMDRKREEFSRSNWHQAISNIGRGVGGAASAVRSVAGLFT